MTSRQPGGKTGSVFHDSSKGPVCYHVKHTGFQAAVLVCACVSLCACVSVCVPVCMCSYVCTCVLWCTCVCLCVHRRGYMQPERLRKATRQQPALKLSSHPRAGEPDRSVV